MGSQCLLKFATTNYLRICTEYFVPAIRCLVSGSGFPALVQVLSPLMGFSMHVRGPSKDLPRRHGDIAFDPYHL